MPRSKASNLKKDGLTPRLTKCVSCSMVAAETGAESGPSARKRKINAAGSRRMAAAQKARWAKIRGEADGQPSSAQAVALKAKRKLSAAGRKAISEATKRRWGVVGH